MNTARVSTLYSNLSNYSRFNLDLDASDITVFVSEFRQRLLQQLAFKEYNLSNHFESFHERNIVSEEEKEKTWLGDNHERFFKDSPNCVLKTDSFLSELGFINTMVYSPEGEYLIVGHSTGLIQMRHGHSGAVLATLRNIQFPPKPIYALEFSRKEERICYAACADGTVYRIEIPAIDCGGPSTPAFCIRADPTTEWLNTQYFAPSSANLNATPFIAQRPAALSLGITADSRNIIAGYSDSSLKIYDMETQEIIQTFKVHKLRLEFIPKKLRRVHSGQVCALRCHNEKQYMFASAGWDKTLRIWDTRCQVGCMMTFEGVDICHDAIDLNREEAVSGSWQNSEALCTWDLVARKRLNIIRVQNRRPDVDGEYIYACRYWKSSQYNRKGKYGIIGGSGTGCVEVINLHNRYISCSYPASGTVLAITSFEDRIAFGGTASVFNLVSFRDPKHEEYKPAVSPPFDYIAHPILELETIKPPPRVSTVNLEAKMSQLKDDEDEDTA